MSPSLLIVDDLEEHRYLLKRYLKETPWRCMEAANGLEAVNLFRQQPFDLILIDLGMPVLNGIEAVREIRRQEQEIGTSRKRSRIIGMTAHDDPQEHQKARDAGCDETLQKPISTETLFRTLSAPPIHSSLDPELLSILPRFLENRKNDIRKLRDLLQTDDRAAMARICHDIKGVAPSYGFPEMGTTAARLEAYVKTAPTAELEPWIQRLETLHSDAEALVNRLRNPK